MANVQSQLWMAVIFGPSLTRLPREARMAVLFWNSISRSNWRVFGDPGKDIFKRVIGRAANGYQQLFNESKKFTHEERGWSIGDKFPSRILQDDGCLLWNVTYLKSGGPTAGDHSPAGTPIVRDTAAHVSCYKPSYPGERLRLLAE
jgi:hypothetical protein